MSTRNRLLVILGALFVLRAVYILLGPFALSPDEAHYWEWSRRLGLSYYSKGPGVAYVIAFFTRILGASELGVRIGAVVFSTAASYILYLTGRDLFKSEKVGFWAAILPNITPLFSIGSILMTTDVLFLFFWAAAVYSVWKAVESKGGGWWYLTGLLIGLGFLCKYTMVLLYPCVALFLIFSREERAWFLRKEPYLGALLSLAAATPVIYWNITHGEVTIKHTMGQAHVGSGTWSFAPFFEFLGAQAGLLSPLIFTGLVLGVFMCAYYGFREGRSGLKLVFFSSAPFFLFFLFKGLHGKVQANWAVASYMTAFPASVWAVGLLAERAGSAGRKFLKGLVAFGLALGAIVSFLAYFPWLLEPLGVKKVLYRPPYNRVIGWPDLGKKVSETAAGMEGAGRTFIMSDTYQITSELAFYVTGNPVTYNVYTEARRMNQYDLWPGLEGLAGQNAVYVKGGNTAAEETVLKAFDRCDKELYTVRLKDGRAFKEFSIFSCYGFKGMEPSEEYKKY